LSQHRLVDPSGRDHDAEPVEIELMMASCQSPKVPRCRSLSSSRPHSRRQNHDSLSTARPRRHVRIWSAYDCNRLRRCLKRRHRCRRESPVSNRSNHLAARGGGNEYAGGGPEPSPLLPIVYRGHGDNLLLLRSVARARSSAPCTAETLAFARQAVRLSCGRASSPHMA
jgi:hypothetical protein